VNIKNTNPFNEKYYGFYRGIVIQNNDPERAGRIKIFIQSLSNQLIKLASMETSNPEQFSKILEFKGAGGSNVNTDSNTLFTLARLVARWARQASPIIGGGCAATYNAQTNLVTKSHSNTSNAFNFTPTTQDNSRTIDHTGVKGAALYSGGIRGGHGGLPFFPANNSNFLDGTYAPEEMTNTGRGSFSVPNVGANVWVFFENGNIEHPVYFAYSFDDTDWHGVYGVGPSTSGHTYPNSDENYPNPDGSPFTAKNSQRINSKAGSIVTDETENRVNITQANGNHIEINPNGIGIVSVADLTKIINGNEFHTTFGTLNQVSNDDHDVVIMGDYHIKVGDIGTTQPFNDWKEETRPLANARARFPVQRTTPSDDAIHYSAGQKQKGKAGPNPVVQSVNTVNNSLPSLKGNGSINTTSPNVVSQVVGSPDIKPAQANQVPAGASQTSASTKGGEWEPDPAYANLSKLIETTAAKCMPHEQKMGSGGTEYHYHTKDCVTFIGATTNDFPTVRVDPIGDMSPDSVKIDSKGSYVNQKPHPYVETVGNDSFPCGNSTIFAGNKYNLIVGSGGIELKTGGNATYSSNFTTLASKHQTNIASGGNIDVKASGKVHISGDIVTLSNANQVLVDSSLGVSRNLIVIGGAFIEGELHVNHITAPVEIQETEVVNLWGTCVAGKRIGTCNGAPVYGDGAEPDCVIIDPHSHPFKNLPLTLCAGNSNVRNKASAMNSNTIISSSPQSHSMRIIEN